ncbi:Isopropylmalate/homocitrate/citramalate synthase [Halanaeroarchaeum sp. HSR-CO]|uniref:LeuA family protein n=1 Tax=Halanaeroarchaeum sp. HSR-CO TaxID=2866382 RepID=UPI00217D15BD|nr:2-isopropylmalate synthase [Halanaeroarchaeum sp. HSR-CO]UWG48744.1 Isopropylmalate/homocitrate/citramalate synthase [Halanaeroarchaeum sp. HSR-CO]
MSLVRCRKTTCPGQPRAIEFFQGTLAQRSEFETVRIFDTTLRDGEQTPRTSFDYDDKREIAAVLDEMGTHVIEAGFPANGDAEFEAIQDIAAATENTVAGLARVVESDVEAALDAGVDMVHVFASTSDVQIEDSMHATREQVMDRSIAAVEQVVDAGVEVMFSPMDATRTDREYLAAVVEAVDEAGTDWINIPDTTGVASPSRFADLVAFVDEHADARIDVHTHDDFGMATANAVAGVEAGADQVQVSVNGIGERAGNAAYEEVVMAAESVYGADTGIDTTRIMELSGIVSAKSDVPVPVNKPVVGDNAFAHESGIHAAGIIENADTFEPGVMTPEMVGAERSVVLGKHTGTHAVRQHLEEAGYDPTDAEVREVTREVKDYAAEKQHVTARDLHRFAADVGVEKETETQEVRA